MTPIVALLSAMAANGRTLSDLMQRICRHG